MSGLRQQIFEVPGIPGITFIDLAHPHLADEVRQPKLAEFMDMHRQYFPGYDHVYTEWQRGIAGDWADPATTVHLWGLFLQDRHVGLIVYHVNARHRVGLVHFIAMAPQERAILPHTWIESFCEMLLVEGDRDLSPDQPLLAAFGEVPATSIQKWARGDFLPTPVRYYEPVGGPTWRLNERPEFLFPILIMKRSLAGKQHDYGEMIAAGLRGFSEDYYQLPSTQWPCADMMAQAAAARGPAIELAQLPEPTDAMASG